MPTNSEIEQEYTDISAALQEQENNLEELFARTESKIMIDNRPLKDCIAEQGDLQLEWSLLASSVSGVERRARDLTDQVYAMVYSKNISNSYKNMTATDAKMAAMADDDYVRVKKLHNNTIRLRDDCNSVLDVIKSRQYSLKDLSNTLVAGVDDHVI